MELSRVLFRSAEEERGVEEELCGPLEVLPGLDPSPRPELDHRVGERRPEEEERDPCLVGPAPPGDQKVGAEGAEAEREVIVRAGFQALGAQEAVGVPRHAASRELEGRARVALPPAEAGLLPAVAADVEVERP